jgi:hypothetical protein
LLHCISCAVYNPTLANVDMGWMRTNFCEHTCPDRQAHWKRAAPQAFCNQRNALSLQ